MRGFINSVLKFLTGLSLFLFVFSISAMDSDSWIPIIFGAISFAWLIFYYFVTFEGEKNE